MNIAYFVPLYPSISLTFIAREIKELEKLNNVITIFAYEEADTDLAHPEFDKIKAQVVYRPPLFDWRISKILWANFYWVFKNPRGYFKALTWIKNLPDEKNIAKVGLFLQIGYFSYLIRKLHIDRIHAHFAVTWTLTAMLASWITGIPLSITTHAADIYANPHPDILPRLFSEVDLLVTISDYNRRFLLDSFPDILQPAHIAVVHCGIEINEFRFTPYSRKSQECLSIVTVGRLIEKKGHLVLVEALDLLKQQGFNFKWTVVGRGYGLPTLQEIVKRKNLEDRVTFVGAAIQNEIRTILQNADVMVLPCVRAPSTGDMDGIPVVLMEAMAVGLPVISTEISGIPELITHEESGLLVVSNDSKALAEMLRRVFETPPDFHRMTMKARERIQTDFNIEVESNRLFRLLQNGSSK